MRKALGVLVAAMISTAPAWAGVTYSIAIKNQGGSDQGPGNSLAQVSADGGQAKMVWQQTNNPMFTKGSYMLVNEKGEMTFVDPTKRTYSKFDFAAMMENVEQMMGAAAQLGFKMEVENPKIEKVLEEPGGEILGYPTTHYRWHTTYTMVFRMIKPMPDRKTPADIMEDTWTTTAFQVPSATTNALTSMASGPMMGELRKIVDLAKAKMTGFPLKTVTVTKGAHGRDNRTIIEVSDLKKADIPASTFAIPADYTEVDMMQPQHGPAMPNLNGQ